MFLPLEESKQNTVAVIALLLGSGWFLLVLLALVHGQIAWGFNIFFRQHDGFYFWLYVAVYVLGGLIFALAGVGGLYRRV